MKAGRKKDLKDDQRCDESSTPHLPDHILMEIFCRLPIETLTAVKCVSKSCLELVSGDTHFAELHRKRSPTELLLRSPTDCNGSFGKLSLLLQNKAVSGSKLSLLFHLPKFRLRSNNNTIDWNCKDRERTVFSFVNSCNGLLCFRNDVYHKSPCVLICNPVTGEFITVPGAELDGFGLCSLGFSKKENRYKLLRVAHRTEPDPVTGNSSTAVFAEICTFKKGSLSRNLKGCPSYREYIDFFDPPYLFSEGKIYFRCPSYREYIDFFDFDDEQFGKLPLPPLGNEYFSKRKAVGVFGGCLSISLHGSEHCIEIWVMKEYGVRDSWTKAYTVVDKDVKDRWSMYPLMYLGNDEVLKSRADNNLVVCNPVLDTSRVLAIGYKFVQVIAYTPTLLRLKDALAGYEAQVWNANSKVKGDE